MNTLVKQLKGVIGNDNLEYFNAFQLKINWTKSNVGHLTLYGQSVWEIGGSGVTVRILDNGYIQADGTSFQEITFGGTPVDSDIFPVDSSKETEFIVVGTPARIWASYPNGFVCKNFERGKYYTGITTWDDTACIFAPYEGNRLNLDFLQGSSFIDFSLPNIRFTGEGYTNYPGGYPFECSTTTLGRFVNLTKVSYHWFPYGDIYHLRNMTHLTLLNLRNPKCTGDIANLGGMTSLTKINANSSDISGSLEGFVAAQYDAGRTSGSMQILSNSANITFNGSKVSAPSGKTLSWTNKTSITLT